MEKYLLEGCDPMDLMCTGSGDLLEMKFLELSLPDLMASERSLSTTGFSAGRQAFTMPRSASKQVRRMMKA